MFYTGEKIRYYGDEAIVLNYHDDEVLIFVRENNVKWVDKNLLEIVQDMQ